MHITNRTEGEWMKKKDHWKLSQDISAIATLAHMTILARESGKNIFRSGHMLRYKSGTLLP